MKKRRKQRIMRGFAAFLLLVSVCASYFSGEGIRADASGVHTIPGTGYLSNIKAARSLNISRSTLSSYTYNNGISGKRVNYTDDKGEEVSQFTVPLRDESKSHLSGKRHNAFLPCFAYLPRMASFWMSLWSILVPNSFWFCILS